MEYTTLNNGIKMPMAGIGTFLLTPDEAEAAVVHALENGYRLIDTANAYVNEKAVGRAMKKSGVARKDIFLETKIWPSFYEQEDAVEKTLQRLDTDYIDLLLIHQPAGNYVAGYRLMEKAYKEGKVKAIGLSNFTKEQVQEILDICEVKPTVLQTEVHPYSQEKELKEFLDKAEIRIQAWYPLGHGDTALLKDALLMELGEKHKKSTAQIILRWHIQDGNIVIPGSKNPEHIKDNVDLFDFSLTDEEMQKIKELDRHARYYTSTPELLAKYVKMVPPVDEQKQGEKVMRKDFGAQPFLFPQPVLIIATYDEEGKANAMNAAWGGIVGRDEIMIDLSQHKTTDNLKKNRAFTVSFADVEHVVACDYVGIVSGAQESDKMKKAGFTTTKSTFVNAPIINELPVTMECELIDIIDGSKYLGKIKNVTADERVLGEDGTISMDKFKPITYEPVHHTYYDLGKQVGEAFHDGAQLK